MTDHGQEERIRELLNEAVSSVEPQYGMDAIRRRTIGAPSRARSRWLVPAAAALATAAASAVFALLSQSQDRPREGSPAATDPMVTVQVYYLGSTPTGPRLFRELHSVQTGDPALAAVNEALSGRALDPDYYSIWGKIGAEATSVTSMGGDIEVDIATQGDAEARPGGVSNADASMALEQLVYTAQEALGLGNDASVQLIVDGRHQATLMGVPISEGLAAGDPLTVQGTVWITDPQDGETIDSGMRIRGRGAFTEANVSWQLLDGLRVAKSGFTMATECCRLSPFSFVLDAPPGNYTIRVYAADMSGGEGFGEADDTKRITIR